MKKITVIPSTINPLIKSLHTSLKKRRVCGYARVSTDSDEQFSSYEAQINYYTNYIKSHDDWEFIGVYTDEGITGTSMKNREGFKSMINDSLEGKIDLIVTKSISRFARNTVDTLVTIRKLKEHGVECFFEKENIYTFDSKGELLITIMSSLAQEESRSISENVTWGHRKAFSDGKVHVAYSTFLGFEKGEGGKLKVNEEEAKTVRLIYRMFLDGHTAKNICDHLESRGILSPGKKEKWPPSTIHNILRNEKYKGDALLQKTYTVDFLSHKVKKNYGEVQQYYVENSHEAIIDEREWDMVQLELARRERIGKAYSAKSLFSSKLVCGECGGIYGPKVWHSNDPHRKVVWHCNQKFRRKHPCKTATLSEKDIKDAFIAAYNKYMVNESKTLLDLKLSYETLFTTSEFDEEIDKLSLELETLSNMVRKMIDENSSIEIAQEEYQKKYRKLEMEFEEKKERLIELKDKKTDLELRKSAMQGFIENFEKAPRVITEWNETLWNVFLRRAQVNEDGEIKFEFER